MMKARAEFLGLPTSLDTARLCLRRFQEGHGAAMFAFVARERARLAAGFPKMVQDIGNEIEGEIYVRGKLVEWYREESYAFGVWLESELIGYISIKALDWSGPKADIGYCLAAAQEGRGLMTEALRAVLAFGFERLGLGRLYLRIDPDNAGSLRVAEKCGFLREGLLRGDRYGRDALYYGLTAADWSATR